MNFLIGSTIYVSYSGSFMAIDFGEVNTANIDWIDTTGVKLERVLEGLSGESDATKPAALTTRAQTSTNS